MTHLIKLELKKFGIAQKYYLYVCRNSFQHPFHYNIFMG